MQPDKIFDYVLPVDIVFYSFFTMDLKRETK